jgi:hypothetical protein
MEGELAATDERWLEQLEHDLRELQESRAWRMRLAPSGLA